MQKVTLNILGLSYSKTQENAYVLVLVEEEGENRIPIVIGGSEAQAIAIELESMKAPRPLTHDLFKSMATEFSIQLVEVCIYKLEEGIFYSKLTLMQHGKTVEIDSRTSDAVALAVRFNAPIYTYPEVVEKAGVVIANTPTSPEKSESMEMKYPEAYSYSAETDEVLLELLNNAITEENYEDASKIRDEIKRRSLNI